MPIPTTGFTLNQVCQEFIPPRLGFLGGGNNIPSLGNMINRASQACIPIGTTGCKLTQFADKERVDVQLKSITTHTIDSNTARACVRTCVYASGVDLRPTNCDVAIIYVKYCIVTDDSINPPYCTFGSSGETSTTTAGTVCNTIDFSNPFAGYDYGPGGIPVTISTVYACSIGFNGFGESGIEYSDQASYIWGI